LRRRAGPLSYAIQPPEIEAAPSLVR
jgi:hypothetical protein